MAAVPLRADLTSQRAFTREEHTAWARRLWARMDRDRGGEISAEELNCDEFMVVLRAILAPLTAGKGVAGYERSEINLPNALAYCLRKADENNDGVLSFVEFEAFLRYLRSERSPEHIASIVFALFDLDGSATLSLDEFREIYRFYLGHHPIDNELKSAWRALDTADSNSVTRAQYARWLRKRAGAVFKQHAPAVQGEETQNSSPTARKVPRSKSASAIHRPAPGLLPPGEGSVPFAEDCDRPLWNSRFSKDFSVHNQALRGNMRMKTWFSKEQSLPDLHKFYCTYRNFDTNRRKLVSPQPLLSKKLVLSTDSMTLLVMPGAERHRPGGTMKDADGAVVPWRENTPRALIRPVWAPGSLLLRVPGPPPAWITNGRDESGAAVAGG